MPGQTDIPLLQEQGKPILATALTAVYQETRKARLLAGSFTSGSMQLTRPLGRLRAGGTNAVYGLLDTSIPAGGIVADAIDAYFRGTGGDMEPLLDALDVQIRYGAHNMNVFTNMNIYLDPADSSNPIKVFVWGFPFEYNFGTVEVPDIQTCMEIWNVPPEPAGMEGYVKAPVNAVGQVFMHQNNANKGIMAAGPCGGA
jgi:hypothetical protein